MAQQIITLCDPCLLEGKEAPGHLWGLTIQVPGAKPMAFEIDVCDMHAQPYRVMLEHLAEDGRKAGKRPLPTLAQPAAQPGTAAAPAPVPSGAGHGCPACDHVAVTLGGLRTHAREVHQRSLAELNGAASIPCTVGTCDRSFQGYQGLSSHLRTAHEYDHDAARAAVQAAKDQAA